MIEIYSASNILEAELIKSLLEENGIDCLLLNKNMITLYGTPIPFGGIKIMVNEKDKEKAESLISLIP
ncbi:MAG: DUF2007 domain-containing protein [Candidatus Aerophobetes bacterium]|nr:DUF2007 domain-containing protein [Candidatus Aerophobetes bacterium]